MIERFSDSIFIFSIAIIASTICIVKRYCRTIDNSSKPYILYVRFNIWIRQLCFTSICILYITKFIQLNGEFEDDNDYLIFGTFVLSLMIDGTNIISNTNLKVLWVVVYASMSLHFLNLFQNNDTIINYSSCILYFVAFISSIIEVVFQISTIQKLKPTEEFTSNIYSYLTFSFLNELLINPMQKIKNMDLSHVPFLIDEDTAEYGWEHVKKNLDQKKSLFYSLFLLMKRQWIMQGFFQFLGSTSEVIAPISLEIILSYVKNNGDDDMVSAFPVHLNISTAVLLLFFGPIIKAIADSQNFNIGRHSAVKVRSALISVIYKKALTADLSLYKEGVGKVNNLIGVDVSSIQVSLFTD